MSWLRILLAVCAGALAFARMADAQPERLPVATFAKLPTYSQAQISPEGTHFAFVTSFKGRKHLLIQEANAGQTGAQPVLLPPIEEADISWFRWANNDRLLISYAFTGQRYRSETTETRLISVRRDGTDPILLVRPKRMSSSDPHARAIAQIQDDVVDFLPEDPDHILLSVDTDLDLRSEVLRINVNTGRKKRVQTGRAGVQHWKTDHSGAIRLGYGILARGREKEEQWMLFRDPGKEKWQKAVRMEWYEKGYRPIAFSEEPSIAFVAGSEMTGREALYKVDLVSGEILETVFSHDRVDIDGVIYAPNGRRVVGVRYTDHRPRVRHFDKFHARLQEVFDQLLPDTTNRIVNVARGGQLMLVLASSDREPGAYYLFDRTRSELGFVMAQRPEIEPEKMAPMQPVSYAARDGLEIDGYLTLPLGLEANRLPTVVLPHGGPGARDYVRYDYWVQFLANRGYAVFQPNFRGSTGYGDAFYDAGRREWGKAMQDDVTDGAKWLIDQGIADARRVCIMGGSYGGYAALMGAVKTPGLFNCAVSINGVTDLPMMVAESRRYVGGKIWTKSIGENRADLKDYSPFHQVDKIRIPVLLIQADDDARVPKDHAKKMARKLKKAKKDVTLVRLKDGGHSLDTEAARLGTLKAVERFLAEHLGKG